MNKICYGDSSLWLCVRVAQAGQPAANCVSEHPHGPPAHSQLDLTEPSGLHLKVWVRLGTSSLLVCILAGRLLCHFLTDGIFRGATQLGKVICRLSILGTQKLPKSQLIWTIKSLQQPGVWVSGLQRGKDLLSWPQVLGAQVCVGRQEGPTVSKSGAYGVFSKGTQAEWRHPISVSLTWPKMRSPSRATASHPPGLGQGRDPTHHSSQCSLLNRQEQNALLLNEPC